MKLYAFQPFGHGQKSFFVAAEDEIKARNAVDLFIKQNINKTFEGEHGNVWAFTDYDFQGWGSNAYELTICEPGQVIINDND